MRAGVVGRPQDVDVPDPENPEDLVPGTCDHARAADMVVRPPHPQEARQGQGRDQRLNPSQLS